MSVKNGQLVRLYNGTETAIENLISGSSIVAGVSLAGLGLAESEWTTWSSTDISSTTLEPTTLKSKATFNYSNVEKIEFNDGNLVVSPMHKMLVKDGDGVYKFKRAKDVILNSDHLIKWNGSSLIDELITEAYTIDPAPASDLNIEDIDVYLVNGYVV